MIGEMNLVPIKTGKQEQTWKNMLNGPMLKKKKNSELTSGQLRHAREDIRGQKCVNYICPHKPVIQEHIYTEGWVFAFKLHTFGMLSLFMKCDESINCFIHSTPSSCFIHWFSGQKKRVTEKGKFPRVLIDDIIPILCQYSSKQSIFISWFHNATV